MAGHTERAGEELGWGRPPVRGVFGAAGLGATQDLQGTVQRASESATWGELELFVLCPLTRALPPQHACPPPPHGRARSCSGQPALGRRAEDYGSWSWGAHSLIFRSFCYQTRPRCLLCARLLLGTQMNKIQSLPRRGSQVIGVEDGGALNCTATQ